MPDMQQFHGVGATHRVIAVAFGEDDPVTCCNNATFYQFFHRCLADAAVSNCAGVKRYGVDTTKQRYPCLGFVLKEVKA